LSEALGIHLVGNEWVREWTLLRSTWRKRGPWWYGLTPPVKPQRVCCKLDETKGSVIVLGRHGKMEMLVTWKHVMKSLLMENVFKLCRV
jgi:hypothetical protein